METYKMIDVNDLQDFIRGFILFIKGILEYTLSSIKRYMLLSLLLVAGITSLGIYRWYSQPVYYEAKMVCEFNNLNRKTYGEMTTQLDQLAKTGSYRALAAALKLPEDVTRNIISIEGKNIVGSPLDEDANGDMSPMYFTVKSRGNTAFKPFEQAFIAYLNSSPYRMLRNEIEVSKNKKKLDLIYKDLDAIDSVIYSYNSFLQHVPTIHDSVAGFANIAALFSYKDQLEDKAVQLEQREKTLSRSVEVLYGFVPPGKPSQNGKRVIWMFAFLALAASIAAPVLIRLIKDSVPVATQNELNIA